MVKGLEGLKGIDGFKEIKYIATINSICNYHLPGAEPRARVRVKRDKIYSHY